MNLIIQQSKSLDSSNILHIDSHLLLIENFEFPEKTTQTF